MAETLDLGLPRNSAKIPEKILQMQSLYTHEHRNGDINDAHNFVVQGTFMQDYEDDKPWLTNLIKFSPTYHDFNAAQLRGYFTWRKYVRQGSLKQASPAFFTMYVYELLNGIGTRDVQDSLDKLLAFTQAMRKQHLGPLGAISMYRRWMLFLGIIYSFPPQTMRKYVDPELLEQDSNLVILRDFDEHNDAEVCQALDYFSGGKVSASPAVAKNPEVARHLFAQAWREINTDSPFEGEPLFVRCFDNPQTYPSEGLSDAVVLIDRPEQAVTYHLTEVTTIEYLHQKWMMKRYDKVFFQTELIGRLVHSVDLVLRKLLKTGHYLRHKAQDQVFDQVAHTVVQQYQARQSEEKAKARVAAISIDFSQLKTIRRDADVTRENLLTDEERGVDNALSEKIELEVAQNEPETKNAQKPELLQQPEPAQKPVIPTKLEDVPDQTGKVETSVLAQYHDVLTKLLVGSDVSQNLRDKHLMASMVADAINDALYEQIGDVVIESDGDNLSLVPDYEEDVRAVLREEHQDE
nr:TerB N-terminal domain-containing protein [Aeriscardovia aeriphila]